MSTGVEYIRDKLLSEGNTELREVKRIECIKLKDIFDTYVKDKVDFLNIDIEGMDLEALESAEFMNLPKDKWPRYIVLETIMPVENANSTPSVKYIQSLGYVMNCVLPHASVFALPQPT
jgi:hypothetical protein